MVFVHSFHGIKERVHVGQLPTTIAPGARASHNRGALATALCKIRKSFVCINVANPSPILEHEGGLLFKCCYFSLSFGHQMDLLW